MTEVTSYVPPKVWTWESESGGRFAKINRPISGSTHDKDLPIGNHPLQLYSLATPNGVKVTVMLEELLAKGIAGAEYDAYPIIIGDGDQFGSGFVEINPNSKDINTKNINQILKIDSSNQQAISDKKKAFEKLGKDASDVDKDRWNKDPGNLEYGLAYLESLMINEDYELAGEVAEEILLYHDSNKRLLKKTSDIHIKNSDDKKAIKYLEKLAEQNDSNTEYLIKLSKAYINIDQYNKAYSTANKAIALGQNNKKAYYQRAEVLKNLADYYASDDLDFCDRVVYELAAEDYGKAYEYKHINGKRSKNSLIEGEYITSVGAWFMIDEKFTTMSPDSDECVNRKGSDCYSFIKNREVNRKK